MYFEHVRWVFLACAGFVFKRCIEIGVWYNALGYTNYVKCFF